MFHNASINPVNIINIKGSSGRGGTYADELAFIVVRVIEPGQ